MTEIIIERWSSADGSTTYRWSIWRDGKRLQMGGPHGSADASERDARKFCTRIFETEPDRVTQL